MSPLPRHLAILAVGAAMLAPSAASAQWSGAEMVGYPRPLYPYELQPGQAYAVEVAPGTYVIHHATASYRARADGCVEGCGYVRRHRVARRPAPLSERRRRRPDRGLVEALRRQAARAVQSDKVKLDPRAAADTTTRIVREKPIVIETRRVVDDPPRVVVRRHYVDDAPPRRRVGRAAPLEPGRDDAEPRVIHANAEVTIYGPDRMTIRLTRMGADAEAMAPLRKNRRHK